MRSVRGKAAKPRVQWLAAAIASLIPLVTIPMAYKAVDVDLKSRAVKRAGQWLQRHAQGPITVIDVSTILAFHAGATFVPFPNCDSDVAIRYLDKKKITFIVLSEYGDLSFRPYLKQWMQNGPPSERAKLVWSDETPGHKRILIYKWTPAQVPLKSATGTRTAAKADFVSDGEPQGSDMPPKTKS
jgi:hypothetical protein